MQRSTKTNSLVYRIFSDSVVPMGLGEIFAQVKRHYPSTAFSTVYRIVSDLEHSGKVIKTDWRNRGGTYEWSQRKHHHHMLCDSCGTIQDVSDELVGFQDTKISRATGYKLRNHSIEISGICPDCQKR